MLLHLSDFVKTLLLSVLAKMQFSGSLFFIGRAKGKTVNLYWHNTYADIRAVLVHIGGLTSERENSPLLLKRRE